MALRLQPIHRKYLQHLVASEDFSPNPVSFLSSAHLSLTLSELDDGMFFAPHQDGPKHHLTEREFSALKLFILGTDHILPSQRSFRQTALDYPGTCDRNDPA